MAETKSPLEILRFFIDLMQRDKFIDFKDQFAMNCSQDYAAIKNDIEVWGDTEILNQQMIEELGIIEEGFVNHLETRLRQEHYNFSYGFKALIFELAKEGRDEKPLVKLFVDEINKLITDASAGATGKYPMVKETLQKMLSEIQGKYQIDESVTGTGLLSKSEHKAKPTFKAEALPQFFDILKSFFSPEQWPELRQFLGTGRNTKEKLCFLENGNKLADAFRRMYDTTLITGCDKKELQQWIADNFSCKHKGRVKEFEVTYLHKLISGNNTPCKSPIIKIKKAGDNFIISAEERKPKQSEKK